MRRTSSKVISAALALLVVGAACWSFYQPYLREHFRGLFGNTIIDTFGIDRNAPVGWIDLDAGPFRLKAPQGTLLYAKRDTTLAAGRIEHPAFTLSYQFCVTPDDQNWMRKAPDYREEPIEIDGRQGILRWATAPASHEPFFLSLYVDHAGEWKGRRFSLEIHGAFATEDRRKLAEQVLRTVKFEELPDWFRGELYPIP